MEFNPIRAGAVVMGLGIASMVGYGFHHEFKIENQVRNELCTAAETNLTTAEQMLVQGGLTVNHSIDLTNSRAYLRSELVRLHCPGFEVR